jgi:ABC-type multidrug transport system fused ATPase/permease subunit
MLRNKLSTISQNIFLFNDSIKNNIRYSNPIARDEEIIKAAKKAGAYDFIMGLENKFETIIGETGKKISGGEKQKISLARAFIKNSEIIIFDEATSHIDNESIKKVQKIINEDFACKSCIIVAHQLPKLIKIDKTIELKKGEINLNHSEWANDLP